MTQEYIFVAGAALVGSLLGSLTALLTSRKAARVAFFCQSKQEWITKMRTLIHRFYACCHDFAHGDKWSDSNSKKIKIHEMEKLYADFFLHTDSGKKEEKDLADEMKTCISLSQRDNIDELLRKIEDVLTRGQKHIQSELRIARKLS